MAVSCARFTTARLATDKFSAALHLFAASSPRDKIERFQDQVCAPRRPPTFRRLVSPDRAICASAVAPFHRGNLVAGAFSAPARLAFVDLAGRLAAWRKRQSVSACGRQSGAAAPRPARASLAVDAARAAVWVALHGRIFSRRCLPLSGARPP